LTPSFRYRIGCDIGGTFTDVVLFDEETGRLSLIKVLSTPRSLEVGATNGIKQVLKTIDVDPENVKYISHATTIATNAIIGQVGLELPKTGFITTKGYKDLVEIMRQIRPHPYDFFTDKPRPLVPRHLRKEVTERIDAEGTVIRKLDEDEVREALRAFRKEGVEAVAVCTLFSFLNPVHEKRIGELIMEELPCIPFSLSHEVLPEFREYERASTTIINALLFKIVSNYLRSLRDHLKTIELGVDLLIMQSSGRTMSSKMAMKRPVQIVESGPAAGSIAAAFMGSLTGYENLVSFDMGGTTSKVCMVEMGRPRVTTEFEVGGTVASGRIMRGSGWPIMVPVIDLVEIGAGGGSIAWIDTGGALRVGPVSAGAMPGPSCYGLGGTEPTITDAYVLLGILNPEYFLGGEMKIHVELAQESIAKRIADPLGIEPVEASSNMAMVANSSLVRGARIVTVERGSDPKEIDMMAFGGAGPMVASSLMDELGFRRVIIPEAPGLFSAHGLLVSNVGHDYVLALIHETGDLDLDEINQAFMRLERRGHEDLANEGFRREHTLIAKSLDMRYLGQSYELNVPIPEEEITDKVLSDIEKRFHTLHEARYGYCAPEETIQNVNIRISAIGIIPPLELKVEKEEGKSPNKALKGFRDIYLPGSGGFISSAIYDRYRLKPGNVLTGPAIIEQIDSTTLIRPKQEAKIDCYRQIILRKI
jgi:N-methylhydantoinase A